MLWGRRLVNLQDTLTLAKQKARVDDMLREIAMASPERFSGKVLVDALFHNPNFWYRLTLVRAALGLAHGEEVGVTGHFNARLCVKTMERIGIRRTVALADYFPPERDVRREAQRLLAATKGPDDILSWKLPFDFPPEQAYDNFLRWQRLASVDVFDPGFEDLVTRCLRRLYAADRLLAEEKFDLVLISQIIDLDEGGLAWRAAQQGIPIIVTTGFGGLTRLKKGFPLDRVFSGGDCPDRSTIDSLSGQQRDRLADIGTVYLDWRQSGLLRDLGSIYAYRNPSKSISRADLVEMYGWDPEKPIITVYSQNWFDYPHAYGLANFRDFLDWIQATLEVVREVDGVNWLFKAHPVDQWYGGVKLDDLMPDDLPGHVALAPRSLNGRDLLMSVDALTTVHGTAGIEFAGARRPVLAADKGWYHDTGVCVWAKTRREYLDLLRREWWADVDRGDAQRLARVIAGMLYCCPTWQGGLITSDDTEKSKLYWQLEPMLKQAGRELATEVALIRRWWFEGGEGYHSFKMRDADAYRLANTDPSVSTREDLMDTPGATSRVRAGDAILEDVEP